MVSSKTSRALHYAFSALVVLIAIAIAYFFDPSGLALAGLALLPTQVAVDLPGPMPRIQAANLKDFDGMTMRDYLKYWKDGIQGAIDHTRYDTRIWAPGTTIAADGAGNAGAFFQKRVGDEELSLDGGTSITKTDYHTNMAEGQKIEKGATLLIDSLQIEVAISHREFNAFTADLSPNTAVVTATDTSSATNHMLLLDRCIIFELWRNKELLAEGTLSDFPSAGGFFGSFGGSTPEGYIQNGFGQPNYLRKVLVLEAGYLFTLKTRVLNAITNVLNVEIRAKLSGLKVSTAG